MELSAMEVLEAIRTRRSVKRVSERSPSRDDLQEILEAALWAPNHHFTQPWSFHVIAGEERQRMGEYIATTLEQHPDLEGASVAAAAADARKTLLRSPVVIAVSVSRNEDPTIDLEDYGAACCAIQNLTLAAWSKNIVSKWRTGNMCNYPATKEYLNLGPEDRIVGLIYLGYPATNAVGEGRQRSWDCISWVGWGK